MKNYRPISGSYLLANDLQTQLVRMGQDLYVIQQNMVCILDIRTRYPFIKSFNPMTHGVKFASKSNTRQELSVLTSQELIVFKNSQINQTIDITHLYNDKSESIVYFSVYSQYSRQYLIVKTDYKDVSSRNILIFNAIDKSFKILSANFSLIGLNKIKKYTAKQWLFRIGLQVLLCKISHDKVKQIRAFSSLYY